MTNMAMNKIMGTRIKASVFHPIKQSNIDYNRKYIKDVA